MHTALTLAAFALMGALLLVLLGVAVLPVYAWLQWRDARRPAPARAAR
jgi:hypothetical protein